MQEELTGCSFKSVIQGSFSEKAGEERESAPRCLGRDVLGPWEASVYENSRKVKCGWRGVGKGRRVWGHQHILRI